jgi:hypothetical protein
MPTRVDTSPRSCTGLSPSTSAPFQKPYTLTACP